MHALAKRKGTIAMVHGDDDSPDEIENEKRTLAPAIPNLPDDLAVEVLSRLPSDTLLWCRSVCKTWLRLFSNPSFIKIHHNHIEEKETVIIHSMDTTTSYHLISLLHIRNPSATYNLDHPFYQLYYGMDIVGSINGLVCLSCPPWAVSIAIWNPLTKFYKYLPRPAIRARPKECYDVLVGFCFDPQTNDYRVVRTLWTNVAEVDGKIGRRTEIYSLNSGTWRETTPNKLHFSTFGSKCDTIVNGEPYWWAFDFNLENPMFVVGLHFGGRRFRKVPKLTCARWERRDSFRLVNYKNSLGVLIKCGRTLPSLISKYLVLSSSNCERAERTINLLVFNRSERTWRVELRIDFPQGIERVLGCSTRGRLVLEDESGNIVLLNPKTEEVEYVVIVGAMAKSFEISNYAASSVLIKGSKQVTGQENGEAYMDGEKRPRYMDRPWGCSTQNVY